MFPISPVAAPLVRLTDAQAEKRGYEDGCARVVCRFLASCRSRSRPGLPLGKRLTTDSHAISSNVNIPRPPVFWPLWLSN